MRHNDFTNGYHQRIQIRPLCFGWPLHRVTAAV